jgi:aspartyl-tRNA(Asn)/glutamyl-tRNA(Gln) amidotransferase subunit A
MISRHGLVVTSSSMDRISVLASDVASAEKVVGVLAGQDELDGTTLPDYFEPGAKLEKPLKIGVIEDLADSKVLASLKKSGHRVDKLALPMQEYALAAYQVISAAETCSNLMRYDGIRYGYHDKKAKTLDQVYTMNRSIGFSLENKKRIMLGNYVLSSENYEPYFLKAQKARTLVIQGFGKAFNKFDVLLCPTATKPDNATSALISLAGLPAISLGGVQIIGPRKSDSLLLALAKEIEKGGSK